MKRTGLIFCTMLLVLSTATGCRSRRNDNATPSTTTAPTMTTAATETTGMTQATDSTIPSGNGPIDNQPSQGGNTDGLETSQATGETNGAGDANGSDGANAGK